MGPYRHYWKDPFRDSYITKGQSFGTSEANQTWEPWGLMPTNHIKVCLHPESSTYANEQVVMRDISYPSLHVPIVSCTHAYH